MFPYGLLPFPDEFFFLAQWWFRIATTIADKPLDPMAMPASVKSCSISISPVCYRHGKAPACSLDKPGRDGIMETERALLLRLALKANQTNLC